LASKVRLGTTPALSALAVVIVAITIFGAIIHEVLRRREEAKAAVIKEAVKRAENTKDVAMVAQTAT
jgi:spermidine/putrescine transport system permease protein